MVFNSVEVNGSRPFSAIFAFLFAFFNPSIFRSLSLCAIREINNVITSWRTPRRSLFVTQRRLHFSHHSRIDPGVGAMAFCAIFFQPDCNPSVIFPFMPMTVPQPGLPCWLNSLLLASIIISISPTPSVSRLCMSSICCADVRPLPCMPLTVWFQ